MYVFFGWLVRNALIFKEGNIEYVWPTNVYFDKPISGFILCSRVGIGVCKIHKVVTPIKPEAGV